MMISWLLVEPDDADGTDDADDDEAAADEEEDRES